MRPSIEQVDRLIAALRQPICLADTRTEAADVLEQLRDCITDFLRAIPEINDYLRAKKAAALSGDKRWTSAR